MNDAHYSTQWTIEEYEPPPSLYVVELERNHVAMLINAARAAAAAPGMSKAEADLFNDAADTLHKQVVNL